MPRRAGFIMFIGFALALVFVTGVSAGAAQEGGVKAKEAEVVSAQDRLMEIRIEEEAASSVYSNALYEMNQLNGQIARATEDLDGAKKRLEEAQADLEERASQVYKSGNVAFMDVLVGVDDFSEFATRLDLWVRLLGEERAKVEAVEEAKDELASRKRELTDQREQRVAAVEKAIEQKERAEGAEKEAEEYLASLNDDLRGEIQARQDRQAELAAKKYEEVAEPAPAPVPDEPEPVPAPAPEVEVQQVEQTPVQQPDLQDEQAAADRAAAAEAAARRAERLAEERAAEREAAREAAEQAAAEQAAAEEAAAREAQQDAKAEAERQAELAAERTAERQAERAAAEREAELAAERAAAERAAAEQAAAERETARLAAQRRAERQEERQAAEEVAAEEAAAAEASASAQAAEEAAERREEKRLAAEEVTQASASASAVAQEETTADNSKPPRETTGSASASASASAAPVGGGGSTGSGSDVIAIAQEHLGTPYVLSPPGPCAAFKAEDCSCFTMLVYAELGIALPDDPNAQLGYGSPVRGAPMAGDLLFWSEDGSGYVTHVGIAMGDGTTIHASTYTGEVTQGTPIDAISGYMGARRVL